MNTLILTGWGWIGYATAAAVARRQFKTADLLGMSRRRLPEHLTMLADNDCQYGQIIIIGVSFEKIIRMLRKLKRNEFASFAEA